MAVAGIYVKEKGGRIINRELSSKIYRVKSDHIVGPTEYKSKLEDFEVQKTQKPRSSKGPLIVSPLHRSTSSKFKQSQCKSVDYLTQVLIVGSGFRNPSWDRG